MWKKNITKWPGQSLKINLWLGILIRKGIVLLLVSSQLAQAIGNTEVDNIKAELLGCHELLRRFVTRVKALDLPGGKPNETGENSGLKASLVRAESADEVDKILLEVVVQGEKSRQELMSFGYSVELLSRSTQNQLHREQDRMEALLTQIQSKVAMIRRESDGAKSLSMVPLEVRPDSKRDTNRRRFNRASINIHSELYEFAVQAEKVFSSMDDTIVMWQELGELVTLKLLALQHTRNELHSITSLLSDQMSFKARMENACDTLEYLMKFLIVFDGVPAQSIERTHAIKNILKVRVENFVKQIKDRMSELDWTGNTNALAHYLGTHIDMADGLIVLPESKLLGNQFEVTPPIKSPTATLSMSSVRSQLDAQKKNFTSGAPSMAKNSSAPSLDEIRARLKAQREVLGSKRQPNEGKADE